MLYYSLNKQSPVVDFKTATIQGQAPDKGLYFPEFIPTINSKLVDEISSLSNTDISFQVIHPYIGNTIPDDVLWKIVEETISFSIPLIKVTERIYSLELFHGPTLAFKDVGARFMSRCLGYFLGNHKKKVTVLVATSGDTGGAVAHGFANTPNVNVVVLYPADKVSKVQEKQITTAGSNVHAVKVVGSFDDCQQLVKKAFADVELNQKMFLTSANSINVARWLPQQWYYFFAYKQWTDKTNLPVICVPSGNFGNICAGLLAHISGLPVKHFVAACNANDTVHQYVQTGVYNPKNSVATLSNAMDVGNPSNFIRIIELFQHQYPALKKVLSSYSISDVITEQVIKKVYEQHSYLLDPHGAVAFAALEEYCRNNADAIGIILETAHPVKFIEVMRKTLTADVLQQEEDKLIQTTAEQQMVSMKVNYDDLKSILLAV